MTGFGLRTDAGSVPNLVFYHGGHEEHQLLSKAFLLLCLRVQAYSAIAGVYRERSVFGPRSQAIPLLDSVEMLE